MSDISLLPEDMRGKEELKMAGKTPAAEKSAGGLRMHVPEAEPEEDIEIIEVDEGDLATVLADEPFMTRLTYKLSSAIDRLRGRLFEKKEEVPPPKVPPQFFRPPKSGLISKTPPPSGTLRPLGMPSVPGGLPRGMPTRPGGVALQRPGERPRARITPQESVPRRVRVIRRVRKPVRVSLVSSKELAELTVDVSRRKWTLAVVAFVFAASLAGARIFLSDQVAAAEIQKTTIHTEVTALRIESAKRLQTWSAYEDLQARLDLLDGALRRHIIITRLFDFLETRTLPTVTYQNAAWTANGSLSLDVRTDSFESAARQLVAFKESDGVLSVDSTAFSMSPQIDGRGATVSFQIILSLNPEMFKNPALTPVEVEASSSDVP